MPAASLAIVPAAQVSVAAYRIPTDAPESDGTLEWDSTTLVVVEITAAGRTGLGYTYADAGVAGLIARHLEPALREHDALDPPAVRATFAARLRNFGSGGLAAMALSAVDVALWDLKAKQLDVSLAALLGSVRKVLPVYGSGGFTSYDDEQLRAQFEAWAALGVRAFKMKIGRETHRDRHRLRVARAAIGDEAELFVDANGAYTRNQARAWAAILADEFDVRWLEEPLPPADHEGLRFLREQVPPKLEITEGEYGADLDDFRRLLEADAADVIMPDATRCGGVTGFTQAAALCQAWHKPISSHCAPALHLPLGLALLGMRHAEYFHDHARIENELFDGAPALRDGVLRPDLSRPGLGLEFKHADAARYAL